MNIGEEICGEWLRHIEQCEFIQYNLKTSDKQGEIDVIGLNMKTRTVYACEVAIHLVTGLQYTKNNQPDNIQRFSTKFRKDVAYVRENFKDYKHRFMLWSPIVRNQKAGAKHNQLAHVAEIVKALKSEIGVKVEPIINREFQKALAELREKAGDISKELDSSVMRYLQIEEWLKAHLGSAGMKPDLTPPSPFRAI
jgi:hypothetical protein